MGGNSLLYWYVCNDDVTMYTTHPYSLLFMCTALIGDSHVMGWGSKAIEIRAVENGQLDGVFMHKRTQKLRFLCEKNDKVHTTHQLTTYFLFQYLSLLRCSLQAFVRLVTVRFTLWL